MLRPGEREEEGEEELQDADALEAQPQQRTFVLQVSGMSCASCTGSVRDALEGVRGVRSADVNYITQKAKGAAC